MYKDKSNTLKIISPAKVNLFLAVGSKHNDYHPVLNILHSILLHDVIYINYSKSKFLEVNIEFLQNEDSDGSVPEIDLKDNLIYKAIMELSNKTKNNKYKIDVYVEKNIPMQAGLAGGSSNAAAALVGAAKIFSINNDDLLVEAASKIGSDVAFFINGGCALYTGKGDILDHKIFPVNREIVLVMPYEKEGLSTRDVYNKFDKLGISSNLDVAYSTNLNASIHQHDICDCHDEDCDCHNEESHNHLGHNDKLSLTDAVKQIQNADNIPLFNNLAKASEKLNNSLIEIKNWLSNKCCQENVLLCGSGSATFAIIEDGQDAQTIVEEAKSKGWWAITSQLANVKARIVPNTTEY